MKKKRCTLCGGKLNKEKRCVECGLVNDKDDSQYTHRVNQSACDGRSLTHVHSEKKDPKKSNKGKAHHTISEIITEIVSEIIELFIDMY